MSTVTDLLRKIIAAFHNVLGLSISRYFSGFQSFLAICSILITTLIHVSFWMFSGGIVQRQGVIDREKMWKVLLDIVLLLLINE